MVPHSHSSCLTPQEGTPIVSLSLWFSHIRIEAGSGLSMPSSLVKHQVGVSPLTSSPSCYLLAYQSIFHSIGVGVPFQSSLPVDLHTLRRTFWTSVWLLSAGGHTACVSCRYSVGIFLVHWSLLVGCWEEKYQIVCRGSPYLLVLSSQ